MKPEKIKFSFEDWGEGFTLIGDVPDDLWDKGQEDYPLGDLSLHDEKGRIFFLEDVLKEPIYRAFDFYLQEARRLNIPGRYDVPELGLKDATFVEVLEAIRDYYARKFGKKSETPAAA